MSSFTYTDPEPRVYPSLAREVAKGDVVEADTNPDEARFEPVKSKAVKAAPKETK